MKILIVGSTGMLGNTLKHFLSATNHKVKTLDRGELNLSEVSLNELEDKIIEKECDILINCAGLIKQRTGVTTANFIAVNSLLPHRLAEICEQQNMRMIHVTTDCVFSGAFGSYDESKTHDVTDDYGRSKSMGEPTNCTVIRTSIIGEEEKNKLSLLEWVKSHTKEVLQGYTRHHWNGVTCLQLCKVIKQIMDENLYWEGVRHIYSDEKLNKYELVRMINEIYDLKNVVEKYNEGTWVDRSLSSEHDINHFNIPFLYKQIEETRDFHQAIRNKEFKEYYDRLI